MRVRKSATTRKAEIIDAALRLADKVGPDRLTTSAIADAVGVTQPAIFRHFPKKQDLWQSVAERIGATMEARWDKARSLDDTPIDQICVLVAGQLRLIQTTPAITAILFSRELHAKNQGLRRAFFELLGRFHQVLAGLAADARDAGELRSDLAPNDVASLILGLVQGLAVRWSISGRGFDLADEGSRLLAIQLDGFARGRAAVLEEG